MYCMPVIKTAKDRDALRKAATSGEACYFLGTNSAPHPVAKKLARQRHPGHVQRAGRDRDLRQGVRGGRRARQARGLRFAQRPEALRLPPNEERDHAGKVAWTAPEEIKVAGPDEKALVYRGGETIEWKVVS